MGVKFWVLNGDAKTSKENAHTQKIKLKLIPVDKDGNPITVSGREPSSVISSSVMKNGLDRWLVDIRGHRRGRWWIEAFRS